MRVILLLLLLLSTTAISAQQLTQTVRGTVVDKFSQTPLPGANVIVLPAEQALGTTTDIDGAFRLENVPIGRQTIQISFLGYNTATLSNIEVTSGKEIVLSVALEEKIITKKEVVIEATRKKEEALNEMTSVSARTFSIEDSKRYAGSLNDVSRMAQNFAGVQGANDTRNDIIVRGNSPTGVLYRLEGMDIPNPNHFASSGTTGGPLSVLNNNVMQNSDFLTGAFPAEYGNALAAVFDLSFRNGNNEKHEFVGQLGMNGAELVAEGPFKKGSKSSYLLAYRYSTLDLFKEVGIDFGTSSIPEYSDLSFKLNFPRKKGTTAIFGLGGNSGIDVLDSNIDTTAADQAFDFNGSDIRFKSRVGAIGITHSILLGKKTVVKAVLSSNILVTGIRNDSLSTFDRTPFLFYENNSNEGKQSLHVIAKHRLSAKHILKVGMMTDRLFFNLSDSVYRASLNRYIVLSDFEGATFLLQPYAQWQYRISNDLVLNTGLHYQHFVLNNSASLEPRLGLRWQVNSLNTLSFGYGLHSQLAPTPVFFEQDQLDDGTYVTPNQDLSFTKSHHFVLGYDRSLNELIRFKTEAYYQSVFDVPVDVQPNSFSMLNQGANYGVEFPDSMQNSGTGYNYGLEMTLEHFLHRGFYFLLTAAIYESKYKGSNGQEFNTAFNGNYTFNFLIGREFNLTSDEALESGRRKAKSSFTADAKVTWNGGQRYVPIDLEASRLAGTAVFEFDRAFEARYPDYFRVDIRLGYKRNGAKITQELALDLQNVFNRKNTFSIEYDNESGTLRSIPQIGILPIVLYRIYF